MKDRKPINRKNVKTHLIVIDDNCRFAIHVSRYAFTRTGFGIGHLHEASKRDHLKQDSLIPLISENGMIAWWWVQAKDNSWEKRLTKILDLAKDANKFFLIDLFGKGEYQYREVIDFLDKKGAHPENRMLVSSYQSDPSREEQKETIWPKSPETLWSVWERVKKLTEEKLKEEQERRAKRKPAKNGAAMRRFLHVLITGQGFEIHEDDYSFGLPTTPNILKKMPSPFGETFKQEQEREGKPYPVFTRENWDDSDKRLVKEHAGAQNLDKYWDAMLEAEIKVLLSGSDDRQNPHQRKKIEASLSEHKMRNAFRRRILRYDWSYLNQHLFAARLNWMTWLTTNYTHFANRAIELIQPPSDQTKESEKPKQSDQSKRTMGPLEWTQEKAPFPDWRIIGTMKEAGMVLKNLLHGNNERAHNGTTYLFKLHGDIGQLHTMAIAGHDKEIFSRLSQPVDSLHDLYIAAENYIIQQVNKPNDKNKRKRKDKKIEIVWHIVGHSLYDKLLIELMEKAKEKSPKDCRHTLCIVNPNPRDPIDNLKGTSLLKETLIKIPLKASEYMARIYFNQLPTEGSDYRAWSNTHIGKFEFE